MKLSVNWLFSIGIERIYGDYQLPKVNIVYEWVDVHRKPMEVELNEFNALNDKLYKLR